jgi:hypothetical protein
MNAWTRRREERRRRKAQKAQDRLHGRGARSRPARRDHDFGDIVEDILLAVPRFIAWVVKGIFD